MRFTPIPVPKTTLHESRRTDKFAEDTTATPPKRVPPNCLTAWAFRRFAQCENGGSRPGFKLRVLLAQALFSMDVLLLDRQTNSGYNTIRWFEADIEPIRLDDYHQPRPPRRRVLAGLDCNISPYRATTTTTCSCPSGVARLKRHCPRAKEKLQELQEFVARFGVPTNPKAVDHTSRLKRTRTKSIGNSSKSNPLPVKTRISVLKPLEKAKLHRQAVEVEKEAAKNNFETQLFKNLNFILEAGQRLAIIGPNGAGKSTC